MTNTTTIIIAMTLGLFLVLIIIDKIYVNIKKRKEIHKNHLLIYHQTKLKETINKIEEEKKFRFSDLNLIKKLERYLDREDSGSDQFQFFNKLINCYYFDLKETKERIEYLSYDLKKEKEQLKLKKNELEQRQQELELRETRIVKIESAQKILNSELVEKINKEID
jgi:hypothetical protein